MSNTLKVSMIETIRELGKRGWGLRRIAHELGLHRNTVRKYLDDKPPKCTISTTGNSGRRSLCVPHHDFIVQELAGGLEAQRIFQDLQEERAFEGSYQSVKRYVRKLKDVGELPFRRMEVLPGTECQVDYGTGAWIIDEHGKKRKTHLFRIVLSYSRAGYSEVSFTQRTDHFLRALENAFRKFGGVPQTVVIDNLKAGVLKPCVYDPELNPKLRDFALHYGTCIMPSRVRTPRHKGKVERQVAYVQNNALKKRHFKSLSEQNEYLRNWEKNVADKRIHGTVRRQVSVMFSEEKEHLKSLPPDLFPDFCEGRRKVHRDGHVEVAGAYYSVPPEYTRREVWVRFDLRTVRILNDRMESVALHARAQPGKFNTNMAHIPPEKISNPERGNLWLLKKADQIGDKAGAWARAMLLNRGIPGTRVLNGLLSLSRKYPDALINRGCDNALRAGVFDLKGLKAFIGQVPEREQQYFAFLKEHPLVRDMKEYEQTFNTREIFQ